MTTLPVPDLMSRSRLRPAMKNKYQVAARAALLALALTAALALTTTAIAQAPPGSLWYNGDFNGVNALANERNTLVTQAAVYEDFNVTAPLGWSLTAVFSDNLVTTVITGADWEIRTGVSEGNAGTLIASGTTNSPLVIPTGRGEIPEYTVEVTGLNVFLPMLPSGQHYWLNVTPVGNSTGRSWNSDTSGANCVGTPCGNDDNAFFTSTFFGTFFTNTNNAYGQPDFSNGVIGTVVPEPATVALLTCGLGALLITVRRRRKMNLTRTCWMLSAFVICLSSAPKSRGQTLGDEQNMGTGFEPVVNCDRRVDPNDMNKRIQFVWANTTSAGGISRSISHELGASLAGWTEVSFDSNLEARIDPFAACDIWSADTTRRMYFGWFTEVYQGGQVGDYFLRSLSGTAVDNGPEVAESGVGDRPWLSADSASLYLSFGVGFPPNTNGYVKQATIPSGTGTVTWGSGNGVDVFVPDTNDALICNAPAAAHGDSAIPPTRQSSL